MVQADVPVIISHVANTLADMETLFPAWDLNINRHMVYHIAEHLAISGPLWPLTMFPFERKWKTLGDLMHQTRHPESNVIKEFRAYKLALHFLAKRAGQRKPRAGWCRVSRPCWQWLQSSLASLPAPLLAA